MEGQQTDNPEAALIAGEGDLEKTKLDTFGMEPDVPEQIDPSIQKPILLEEGHLQVLLQSEEFQAALHRTFEIRARCRGPLSSILLNNTVGGALVRAGVFKHPTLREQEIQEDKIKQLARMMEETTPHLDAEGAEITARLEPDFQPRSVEQVLLDTVIDIYAKVRAVTMRGYDPNRNIDYSYGFDIHSLVEAAPIARKDWEVLKDHFPQVLLERKAAHLRDRFFKLLVDKDWEGFLDFMHSQYRSPQFSEQILCWVFERRHYIFPNQHFRQRLFHRMMTLLIEEGQIEFERFDKFWQEVGMDLSDTEELKALSKTAFPMDLWYDLMNENPKRYSFLQQLLQSYGICP